MGKIAVAPLVGAWIEIDRYRLPDWLDCVAPLVGAWIEIVVEGSVTRAIRVAPLVGAWIEIKKIIAKTYISPGRSPCGSVD